MSFFGSDAFLEALASARFRRIKTSPVIVRVGNLSFRLLKVGKRRFATNPPFLDFHSPLTRAPAGALETHPYLSRVDRGIIGTSGWSGVKAEYPWMASPLVDWSSFADWQAFEEHVSRMRGGVFRDARRRTRRLQESLGGVELVYDADHASLLDKCFQWKASHCRETGLHDPFGDARNVALFRELRRRRDLLVSALWAGGQVAAIHLGVVHEGRFYYWIPAYERRLGAFAPGRLLLHHLLRESQSRGHKSFEFLLGDEDYKFHYADKLRLIGAAGQPPALERAWQVFRPRIASAARKVPVLYHLARDVKHRVEKLRDVADSGFGQDGARG